MQPSRYALHLLGLWLRRNAWWAFGVPVVVSLILAMFVDTKFVYLAVVLVCLALPHVFVTVYWRHLLSDATCRWILPHTVSFTADAIAVEYVAEADETDTDTPLRAPFDIDMALVTSARIKDDILVLTVGDNPYDIIIVPLNAFYPPSLVHRVIQMIRSNRHEPE